MSDKVSIDSLDDLIRFRDHLRSFNAKLGDEFSSVHSHWGGTWVRVGKMTGIHSLVRRSAQLPRASSAICTVPMNTNNIC